MAKSLKPVMELAGDTIGARVRAARKKAGLSQKALGDSIGASETTIRNWESGRKFPTFQNAEAAARRLGVLTPWLWSGEGGPLAENPASDDLAWFIAKHSISDPDELSMLRNVDVDRGTRDGKRKFFETVLVSYRSLDSSGSENEIAARKGYKKR